MQDNVTEEPESRLETPLNLKSNKDRNNGIEDENTSIKK
jgi:hypothetical protein